MVRAASPTGLNTLVRHVGVQADGQEDANVWTEDCCLTVFPMKDCFHDSKLVLCAELK